MNEKLMSVLNSDNIALHDLYKDISQIYIDALVKTNKNEFYEFVKKDYRFSSLLDLGSMNINDFKELIDINPQTLYSLYDYVYDLELFEYILTKDNLESNIYNTILNVLSGNKHISFQDSFVFVEKHIDKFKKIHAIERYICSKNDLSYTLDELLRIAKLDLMRVEFYNYDSFLLRYDDLNNISRSIIDLINKDVNNFYILYKEIALNTERSFSDFLINFFDLGFSQHLEYEKIIQLYHDISETDSRENLIYFCIHQNWLQVFDDLNLDYMQSMYHLFSIENPNLDRIKNFDGVLFSKTLSKNKYYKLNWRDYSKFLTFYEFLKLKFAKREDNK